MIISIIAAIDQRGAIGQNNRIPWRQSADLRRFQSLTTGHHVVMGRRTYESLPEPRQLPGRTMIVLSTDERFRRNLPSHVIHHGSIFTAIEYAEQAGESELFLIGGWEVYMMGLLRADRMYLTRIDTMTDGKVTKFPEYATREWEQRQVAGPYPADSENEYRYTFELLERIDEKLLKRAEKLIPVSRAKMETRTCPQCGEQFTREESYFRYRARIGKDQKFCSTACGSRSYSASIAVHCTCTGCGVSFTRARSVAKRNKRLFCSLECMRNHTARKLKPMMEGL